MSEKYKATGIIHSVSATKQVSERFSKRDFVVETERDGKYPQLVQFQAVGDKCSMLDGAAWGDTVTVHFNLKGREWKSPSGEVKFFNTLDAWKIELDASTRKAAPQVADGGDIPF